MYHEIDKLYFIKAFYCVSIKAKINPFTIINGKNPGG